MAVTWDLTELKQAQVRLDNYIHDKKGVDYIQTYHQRCLALVVELNELANNTKCFKYWSANRVLQHDLILEEYVDCLHFCLSLTIYYKIQPIFQMADHFKLDDYALTQAFWNLNTTTSWINSEDTFYTWMYTFLVLGQQLGFSLEQITDKYFEKANINFQRQDQGY